MKMNQWPIKPYSNSGEDFLQNKNSHLKVRCIQNDYEKPSLSSRTLTPTCTGTSVLGVCFDRGVCIAADTLCSYGSLARFPACSRIMKVNELTVLGMSGDYADYQYVKAVIEQKVIDDYCMDDGFYMKPLSLLCWLTRVLYKRRSKFNPLWNQFVVGGLQDGQPCLGFVDKLGTAYQDTHIATGYGAYLALPMMRSACEAQVLDEFQAKQLLHDCLKVLYYRDARAYPKYEVATVTSEGVKIEGMFKVEANMNVTL